MRAVQNVGPAPLERWGDGVAMRGRAGQDELWRTSDRTTLAELTVTTHADAWLTRVGCVGGGEDDDDEHKDEDREDARSR